MKKQVKSLFPLCTLILGVLIFFSGLSSQQTAGELFEKALYVEEGQGDLQKAIGLYQDIVKRFPGEREAAAKAQLHIGLCYEKLGLKEAENAFQKVINDFPEQQEAVKQAREKLSLLPGARAALEKGGGEIKLQKIWGNAIDSFFMGATSPDGRYMTYIDWENFANLGVRDLVKGENRLLTDIKTWEDGEMCYYSVFSPDGGRIAYPHQAKGDMRIELRTVNLDGSSMRVLHDGTDVAFQVPVGWTADGKQILTVIRAKDEASKIAFVSAADGSIKDVKALLVRLPKTIRMSLSPDEKTIALCYLPREDSENRDILLLSVEGGHEVTLVEHPADDVLIGWSPDGRQVLFASDRTGSTGIWTVRVSDGKAMRTPELVRGDMGNFSSLGITRDGKLYYGIYTGWSDIFVAPINSATGGLLAPPTKAVRKYETFNTAPDWSPDGQFLICRSSRGKKADETPVLLIRSMRTNEIREVNPKIPPGGLNFHFIRWSPDGRSILGVGSDEKGKYGALLSIDVQTGEAKILVRSDRDDPIYSPNWAPDGKAVYFIRSGKESRRIIRFDLDAGVEGEISRYPSTGNFWMTLSPDGRHVTVCSENKIKVISADGTESRELTEAKYITTIAWTADGKNILYGKAQDGSQEVVDLWCVPATGGEPQKLGLTMPLLMHLRVSPDGNSIAFSASEQPRKSEVWVMENFLPKEKQAR